MLIVNFILKGNVTQSKTKKKSARVVGYANKKEGK